MQRIIEFFSLIWDVITNAFSSLGHALTMVLGAVGFTNSFTAFLPGILGAAVTIFIAIYVVRFLLLK